MGCRDGMAGREYLCLHRSMVGVYARTRTGKDRSFVIPNIFTSSNSLLLFDPKGEDFDICAGELARLGYDVFKFNPGDDAGRTHCYNPLDYVDRWGPRCFTDVSRVAYAIIPEMENMGDKGRFWDDAARDAMIGAACILAETPGMPLTLYNVLRMFSVQDGPRRLAEMIQRARDSGMPYMQAAVDAVSSYLAGSPEQVQGIAKTVTTKLALWRDPQIAASTSRSDFDLRNLRKRRMAVFVATNQQDSANMQRLLSLLFQQAMNLNTRVEFGKDPAHKHRVTMILNEAWMLGPNLQQMANASSFVDSYGFRIAYVTQSKAQLRHILGEQQSENLFSNTMAQMIFGASSWSLCKEFSEEAGNDTVDEVSVSKPRLFPALSLGKHNQSISKRRRPLLLPQEVEAVPADMMLLRAPGQVKVKARKVVWDQDPLFRGLKLEPPLVSTVDSFVPRDDGTSPIMPPEPPQQDRRRVAQARPELRNDGGNEILTVGG